MALLFKIRDFVEYVHKKEDTPDELRFINDDDYQKIMDGYSKERGIDKKEMKYILAKASDYLRNESVQSEVNTQRIATNPFQASDFLEQTVYGLVPKGVFMAWLDKNHKPLTLMMSFVTGVLVTAGIFIIKWIVTGNP
jgi:hypothetical protein